MSMRSFGLSDEMREYMLNMSVRESDILRELREETAPLALAVMQVSPEQGQFMQMLIKLTGARRCIEIGVFTGYSSTCIALALPQDGELIACDTSEEWTAMARHYWQRAGVAEKIQLRLAPARDTLDALLEDKQRNSFDFVFIDADKVSYIDYYERCLSLLKPGGLMAIDNVFWDGAVIDKQIQDADTQAIRQFNQHVCADTRVEISMLPIGDGLTLARKIGQSG